MLEERPAAGFECELRQFIDVTSEVGRRPLGVRATVRELSHALKRARGGITSDDAMILLVEWRGGTAGTS